jgi:hypothetical protein
MPLLQKQFMQFAQAINLANYNENAGLRDKREIVIVKLQNYFSKKQQDEGGKKITFKFFNQGSYAMHIGVQPLDQLDYDIDVGLIFNITKDDYRDPSEVKNWVYEALDGHTNSVEYKYPCITVSYSAGYHVDLTCYVEDNGCLFLAKSHKTSDNEKKWEHSESKELISRFNERFIGSEVEQFRRVIKYLKRWKDYKFRMSGHAKPRGIGLALQAYNHFQPKYDRFSNNDWKDLDAFIQLVDKILSQFGDRLVSNVIVAPWDDIFRRMSDNQMKEFREKLVELSDGLKKAKDEADPVEAAKIIRKQLGEDFPLPDPSEGSKKTSAPAIISHSQSA